MFSQIAIVGLGLFLVVLGIWDGDYVNVGVGILVGFFAVKTLLKLKEWL